MKKVMDDVGPFSIPEPTGTVYADLVEAIAYQQVSIKAAKTVYERFLHRYRGVTPPADVLIHETPEVLQRDGFSLRKGQYMINIARFFEDHTLKDESFAHLTDQEIIELLTRIKGVGKWTVEMILISSLMRPDVLPILDLGIQQAMQMLYELKSEKKVLYTEMEKVAQPWQPFRTYATLLLWRWKRIQMGLEY